MVKKKKKTSRKKKRIKFSLNLQALKINIKQTRGFLSPSDSSGGYSLLSFAELTSRKREKLPSFLNEDRNKIKAIKKLQNGRRKNYVRFYF